MKKIRADTYLCQRVCVSENVRVGGVCMLNGILFSLRRYRTCVIIMFSPLLIFTIIRNVVALKFVFVLCMSVTQLIEIQTRRHNSTVCRMLYGLFFVCGLVPWDFGSTRTGRLNPQSLSL